MPPIFPPQIAEAVQPSEKDKCEARGWIWDAATQTCNNPDVKPIPERFKTQEPTKVALGGTGPRTETEEQFKARAESERQSAEKGFGVIKDEETGRLSGFQRGDKTVLGLKPSEVIELATREAGLRELPIRGQAEAVLERQRQELQNVGAGLAGQVGASPSDQILAQLESQISASDVNYLGALASAVPGIIPDLIGGAAAGGGALFAAGAVATAATGGAAAPIAGAAIAGAAVITGVANAVRGFYSDFVSDVERQKSELIETPIRSISETKPVLGEIINAQNANPQDAIENLATFNNQLAFIDIEYDRLKDLTDDDLNKFLGDTGINQLQEFQVFYVLDGERDRLVEDMQLALANPDPSRIRPTSLTLEDIKKRVEEELR